VQDDYFIRLTVRDEVCSPTGDDGPRIVSGYRDRQIIINLSRVGKMSYSNISGVARVVVDGDEVFHGEVAEKVWREYLAYIYGNEQILLEIEEKEEGWSDV